MSSIGTRLSQNAAVRLIAGFVLAAILLLALGWLVTGPYKNLVAGFDTNIRYFMRHIQSPMWTSLLMTMTELGSTLYLFIIGSIAGIVFLALRWFRSFLLFIIAMVGQAALHHGGKWLFERPRPSTLVHYYRTVEGFSFPSGHAVASFCMYATIAWIVTLRLENPAAKAGIWILTGTLIFLIAMSRAYIGIHYPTDVVAGLLVAAIWTASVMSAERRRL